MKYPREDPKSLPLKFAEVIQTNPSKTKSETTLRRKYSIIKDTVYLAESIKPRSRSKLHPSQGDTIISPVIGRIIPSQRRAPYPPRAPYRRNFPIPFISRAEYSKGSRAGRWRRVFPGEMDFIFFYRDRGSGSGAAFYASPAPEHGFPGSVSRGAARGRVESRPRPFALRFGKLHVIPGGPPRDTVATENNF